MPKRGRRVVIKSTGKHGAVESYTKAPAFSMVVLCDDGTTVTVTDGHDVMNEHESP
jgi:hypothetical protein